MNRKTQIRGMPQCHGSAREARLKTSRQSRSGLSHGALAAAGGLKTVIVLGTIDGCCQSITEGKQRIVPAVPAQCTEL